MDLPTLWVGTLQLNVATVLKKLTLERRPRVERQRYLISGTHGFIGSKATELLVQQGHQVARLDRDGKLYAGNVVLDFAAFGNSFNQKDVQETYRANVLRVITMLEEAKDGDYEAIILTSTSSVKLDVQTPYSASKRAMEELSSLYVRDFDLPLAVVRPLTVTGVGEQQNRLIPTLIRSCLYGEHMNFVPQPSHDFIDVSDFISGVLRVADNIPLDLGLRGKIFEIGTGTTHTNQQVREIVEQVTGRKANVTVVDSMRPYDTELWMADMRNISELDWKPEKNLYDIISEMVEHERKNPTNK